MCIKEDRREHLKSAPGGAKTAITKEGLAACKGRL
jgi:hypothetical protein